jgi:hypothetical protein
MSLNGSNQSPVADINEIRPQYSLNAPSANALFSSSIVRNNGTSISSVTSELDTQVSNLDNMWTLATPSYTDQVLPFNVTLTGANEYGAMTAGKILGIEILNEGSGISVDDAVSEAPGHVRCPRRRAHAGRAVQLHQHGGRNHSSEITRSLHPAGPQNPRARARQDGWQPVPAIPAAPLPGAP